MEQLLPRGYALSPENRIKKQIAGGAQWQIYSTSQNGSALAVLPELYGRWVAEYGLPEGLFRTGEADTDCRIFAGSADYLISSMEQGPFPGNIGQVDAFSVTFRMACSRYPGADFHDAIYIEEYSLLLPVTQLDTGWDKRVTYGKWLCAGVNISIDSFDRVRRIMGWIPGELLENSAKNAGFLVRSGTEEAAKEPMQEIVAEEPKAERNDESFTLPQGRFMLVGRPQLEQFFNENIVDIVLHREEYARMGISFPGATILHGPPGCGKTYAVERLCEYLGWKRFDIDSGTIGSSYIHDTSKKIAGVFQAAMDAAPSILVIDEMEAFLSDRAKSGTSGTHHMEEVAEFLRKIPEAIAKGVLIFAMTNVIDQIDPAILRRGRFDYIIEVSMPSAVEVESLLAYKFATLPVEESVDIKSLASALAGRPMSDATFVLREAGRCAIRSRKEKMDTDCFREAMNKLPKKKETRKIGFV